MGGMVTLCLCVTMILAGCDIGPDRVPPPAPTAAPPPLTILFATGNQGVLAACGCPSNPSGGFSKRQQLIEDFRQSRPAVLVVDAGDLFPDRPNAVKTKYVAQAVDRAAYDAVALGDQEWLLGLPQLTRMATEHKLPFICANVRSENSEPLFQPHVIREAGGLKVGIFAVVADEAYGFPPREWRKGLKVEPPIEAAKREVKDLKEAGCQVIVALSHQAIYKTRELAAAVPGIGVIVSGHDEKVLVKPEKIGQTLLVAIGEEGNFLGAIGVRPAADGGCALTIEMTELSARVPDSEWVMDLYWKYVNEAKDEPPPDWTDSPILPSFETSEACGKCHIPEYKQWAETRHAHAYQTIERTGRQNDPECLMCHTMGLGRKGGFVSVAKTPELGRVTCQACHPVTSDHGVPGAPKDPKLDPMINLNSRVCMSCHGPVQSPNFDYYTYKPKIVHPKPPAPKK
jgi:hypothetical protein